MSVIIRYPLKIQNVISEIKSQEAYVVIPAFFGFTYASQIIKGVISAPREVSRIREVG